MEIQWLLLALISAAAAILISKFFETQQKLPPGPRPWPIIGNLNLLGSIPHQSLHHLSQKYGELMLLKFGKFPVLVASSPEMAKKFLKEHDAVFASRPMFAAYKHVSYNYSDVSFSPYGPYWREVRKIFMTKVLSPRKLEESKRIRWDERITLLSRLKSETGKPVELRKHLSRFTLSTICKMVFKKKGLSEREEDESMEELGEMVHEWFMLNGAFNIGDWVPWLDFLDLQGYVKKMKALRGKMDRFCDSVIRDHLAGTGAGEGEDFVDFLLQKVGESEGEVEFTLDCVKALIMVLFSHHPFLGKH